MLLELHVRNLALIEKADVEFGEGLNILTGETGAGKSIIIGSVTMALGGKASRESIRHGADHAYVELVFSVSGEDKGPGGGACRGRACNCLAQNHGFQKRKPYQ